MKCLLTHQSRHCSQPLSIVSAYYRDYLAGISCPPTSHQDLEWVSVPGSAALPCIGQPFLPCHLLVCSWLLSFWISPLSSTLSCLAMISLNHSRCLGYSLPHIYNKIFSFTIPRSKHVLILFPLLYNLI